MSTVKQNSNECKILHLRKDNLKHKMQDLARQWFCEKESGLYSGMNSEYEVINAAVAQDIPGHNSWDVRCGKCFIVKHSLD